MRAVVRGAAVLGLIGLGMVVGASGVLEPLAAQDEPTPIGQVDETQQKIRAADEALAAAQDVLQSQNRYVPAITGMNAFAVTVGGVNAVEDLETGRGVDPETFAGLYAGRATPEVKVELSYDDQGRLLYKNKLVRLYPIARLQQLFAERDRLAGLAPQAQTPAP